MSINYDSLPQPFRVQVVHILRDLFGRQESAMYRQGHWFSMIHDALAREYGVFDLTESRGVTKQNAVFEFLLNANVEQAIDTIEISFRLAERIGDARLRSEGGRTVVVTVEDAISELNHRFREHNIGYQFESGVIMRSDSEYLHQEAVRPALHLLCAPGFTGAETEFLNAHWKYRQQQYEDAISECLKAFESTLKIICQKKGWPFSQMDTASKLIAIVFDKSLVPNYLKSEFSGLRSVLESGVPTIRNKDSGHGRGDEPRDVPAYLAAYVLHLTASTIVFLIEASRK